jgi:hypothetical protein
MEVDKNNNSVKMTILKMMLKVRRETNLHKKKNMKVGRKYGMHQITK